MKKKISILGSTGSIGLDVLKIVSKKKNLFIVNILAANKNYKLICKQIHQFKPKIFVINDYKTFLKVKKKYKRLEVKILNNFKVQKHFSNSDISVAAIPGIAGLAPTIELVQKSKKILIANKESVVCGWNIIQKLAKRHNTKIIPVDSEHFSIMQLLKDHKPKEIKKIYLTASGGPFLNYSLSQLKKVQPSRAIKHPKWKMGKKITIDSSTMMNKILELIEAQKLFNIPSKKLDILIHPNSLVHAIVMFNNGITKMLYHQTTMIMSQMKKQGEMSEVGESLYREKPDSTITGALRSQGTFKQSEDSKSTSGSVHMKQAGYIMGQSKNA